MQKVNFSFYSPLIVLRVGIKKVDKILKKINK